MSSAGRPVSERRYDRTKGVPVFKIQGNLRSTLLLGAATAAAVSISGSAFAQQQNNVETVVVTGSRIPQPGIISASPVTAVSNQEIKLEGTTNVENLLNNLPSVVPDFTNTMSNGATGQATVDLRGLGSSRTLVLIDGKRLMPSAPDNPVADLNQVPAALIDHVEVLTGGASAVYGSDAEAGVVNFIMRKDFEGIEVDGQLGIDQAGNGNSSYQAMQTAVGDTPAPTDYWGGRSIDATVIVGTNTADGKGNVTAYLGYRTISPVLQSRRDFSACSISVNSSDQHHCSGSSNLNRWLSIDNLYASQPFDFFETGSGTPGSGAFVPWGSTPGEHYNYGALNYMQRPDVRWTGGYEAHYQAAPWADVYSSFMFMDDHTLAQIAPSGLFLGTGRNLLPSAVAGTKPAYVEVNCSNPLMTAQENQDLCGLAGSGVYASGPEAGRYDGSGNIYPGQALLYIGRRDIEGGNRIDDLRHTSYRMVTGVKGDLDQNWSYDVSGQYGITLYTETYDNEFSVSRVQNALQVNPDGNCNVFDLGIDTTCVPLDIFNGIGSITPSMLKYVSAQGFKEGFTQEYVVTGSMTGDLTSYGVQSPWAHDGVSVAFGAEYRKETLELKTSRDFQTNDLYGQGGATLPVPESSFNVAEGFAEFSIPIIQDAPFAENVTTDAAFRYSAYSTAGDTWTYKDSIAWQVVDDLKFRGSYERAVRAPNVLELFAPANIVLFGGNDPCANPSDSTVYANCQAHGVANPGTLINCPASQCNQQAQGNIALKPEESDTWSAGVVLTPTFLPGFTASVDYWSIKVNHYVAGPNPNTTLSACYGAEATTASQAIACPLVQRGSSGVLFGAGFVNTQTINLSYLKTDGVDFEANYLSDLGDIGIGSGGLGSISVNFIGTFIDTLVTQPFKGYFSYNCAGLFGVTCGTPTPKWHHKMRVTWQTPWDGFQFSVQWRYIGGSKLDLNTSNPILSSSCGASSLPCPDLADGHIAAYNYFDLAAAWDVAPGMVLRAGVNNVFDKDPPVLDANNYGISAPAFGNGNTYPGVYDSLGRTMFVSGTVRF
jgi:iron complex outermembrane recepter protein